MYVIFVVMCAPLDRLSQILVDDEWNKGRTTNTGATRESQDAVQRQWNQYVRAIIGVSDEWMYGGGEEEGLVVSTKRIEKCKIDKRNSIKNTNAFYTHSLHFKAD